MARLRSVLPGNSSCLAAGLLLFLACGSTARRGEIAGQSRNIEPILNLQLVGSYGPVLSDRITLIEPSGVTVNKIGEIYISDRSANSVYRLSPQFGVLSGEGGIGASLGTFNRPVGLDCDQALNVYVADSGNRRIQVLDRNLYFAGKIDSYFDQNDQSTEFSRPEDIRIDREGNFWIADNDRVLKLNPFNELLQELSYNSSSDFSIGRVSSIDISSSDLIAIGDPGNRQVIIATINGNHVSDFPAGAPSCVAWDDKGLLWVADDLAGRLDVFDVAGNSQFRYTETTSGFRPSWITFDLSGRLIMLDSERRRVFLYVVIRGIKP